jgi:hypothetical protein
MNKYIIVLISIIILSTLLDFLYSNKNDYDYAIVENFSSGNVISGNVSINIADNVGNISSSGGRYDSTNINTKYHADFPSYTNPDLAGNIVYYQPGSFTYTSSSYVPYYEDSVFLSRTNKNIINTPTFVDSSVRGGFCSYYKTQPSAIEQKCNGLDGEKCASTDCCVLLGGKKCVYGNETGPIMKANYSDFLIKNKEFYHYRGKCYGNCPP